MKKFYQSFIALLAVLSFSLVSCSEDENASGGNTLEINGTEYAVSKFADMTGSWEEDQNSGDFTISVDRDYYGAIVVDYYTFDFTNNVCPTVGDDIAEMDLVLTPLTSDSDDPLWDNSDTYVSGHAIVTKTNPDESELTVRFENLRMGKDGKIYTFNGTVTLTFFFYGSF